MLCRNGPQDQAGQYLFMGSSALPDDPEINVRAKTRMALKCSN